MDSASAGTPSTVGPMAPPKRRAALGTEASILEDLVLARDAVGLAAASATRLAGTLILLYGPVDWSAERVERVREVLARHARRICFGYEQEHSGDPCAVAAANSVRSILLQPPGGRLSALSIRRDARSQAGGCFIADDSLRKREAPVLAAIARSVYEDLRERPPEELPTVEAAYELMKPYAALAGQAVEHAVDLFNRQAEIDDKEILVNAAAYAIWGITQTGVFPVYAQQVAVALPRSTELSMVDQLVVLLTSAPFQGRDEDALALVRAVQDKEQPGEFLERLMNSGETEDVVRRLAQWLDSCTQSCTYFRSDRALGYCAPHYYVALCEAFVQAIDDLPDGGLRDDVRLLLAAQRPPTGAAG